MYAEYINKLRVETGPHALPYRSPPMRSNSSRIEEIESIPYVPVSHPFVERLIGMMRREFLDRALNLERRRSGAKLEEFRTYYNFPLRVAKPLASVYSK